MRGFRTEFVGGPQDESVSMPKRGVVCKILKELWAICLGKPLGDDCYWTPQGEFCFRGRCKSKDRIFRVRDFEGRGTANEERAEYDGGPGRGGLDLLGKYTFKGSMLTIYVDSCRRAVGRKYRGVDSLEGLIEVVLIHELAHLVTHRGLTPTPKQNESDHFWEYTAQCATYAYLNSYRDPKILETFERLSPRQPFIYRTWEGLKAVQRVHAKKRIVKVVQSVFSALIEPPPPEVEDQHFTSGFEE
jgi:hypothetical protein